MWHNLNEDSPTHKIGNKLLKQKSRRLLDGVLRKRILVDSMRGYGDELQYNVACRSPNYRPEDLSSALDRLRFIKQSLMNRGRPDPDGFLILQKREGFAAPVYTPKTMASDRNANYLTKPFAINTGKQKPPIFVFSSSPSEMHAPTHIYEEKPLVHTKNSARSAISNALSNSMGFMDFSAQSHNTPNFVIKNNYAPTTKSGNSRIVPINVQQKTSPRTGTKHFDSTQKTNRDKTAQSRCKSTIYVPMSVTTNSTSNSSIITMPMNHCNFMAESKNSPSHMDFVTQSNSQIKSCRDTSVEQFSPPALSLDSTKLSNGGASKFRIKKISIAAVPNQQKPNTRTEPRRNYVTGVMIQKNGSSSIRKNLIPDYNTNELTKNNLKDNDKNIIVKQTHRSAMKPQISDFRHADVSEDVKDGRNADTVKRKVSSTYEASRISKEKFFDVINNTNEYKNTTITLVTNGSTPHVREEPVQPIVAPKVESEKPEIPRFYFPKGKPRSQDEIHTTIQKISEICSCFDGGMVPLTEMGLVAKACNLSIYWKGALFYAAADDIDAKEVSESSLIRMWKKVTSTNHDQSSRFVALLCKPTKNCLDFEDFLPLLKDIVDSHPGLVFLKDAPEFHTRYMNTVIARIFYVVNRSWSGQITAQELRKSNFLTVLSLLEEEDDINAITDYFSYEHFYVIYCKFWELDTDHDLVIDKHDLIGYGDGVLSSRLIERVLSGAVTRWDTSDHQLSRMSYVDFVWFILSEEDKKSPTSIEYWFRCMDLDGDGVISMYEMEYFYEEQSQKLEQLDIEPLPFEDCICQIFDIVNPKYPGRVSLKDLKTCKMAHVFFDTFFNIAKYLNNEQKDPLAPQNNMDGSIMAMSDWDNFAAEEYEMLVAEEQSTKLTDLSKILLEEDDSADILDRTEDLSEMKISNSNNPYIKTENNNNDQLRESYSDKKFIEGATSSSRIEPGTQIAQTLI
uniref:uncharacterized protein LOC120345546 isoform X1 n=1 Tax=Styela clava TaxID=7725 RepID=UPI0019393C7F|nr:uncharacterized protein LOC120345546 isoform X1 [Styela clava]